MVPLRWVEQSRISDPAPRRTATFSVHGDSHVPWSHVPSVRAWTLQGRRGYPGSPLRPGHDDLVTTARGDDLNDSMERATHQVLMEFCEHHLPGLDSTAIALLPVWNEGSAMWSERVAAVSETLSF
jgi:hypothetical protein